MAKRFTRNIRSIKDIEKQPKETNGQNDLLSDENHVYVRNKDKYEQITGGVKEVNGETPDENGHMNLQIKDLKGQEKLVRKNQLDEDLEGIELGGRNYIRNSNQWLSKDEAPMEVMVNKLTRGTYVLSIDVEVENADKEGTKGKLGAELRFKLEDGSYKHMKCWYYPEQGESFKGRIKSTLELPSKPKDLENHYMFADLVNGDVVRVGLPKLERGNVSSNWSPAPEDLVNEAKKYTDKKVSSSEKKINNTINGIQASGENLIQNGNFENGFTGWNPPASASLVNNERTSGKAVRLKSGDIKLMTSIPVEPGRTYEFGYWYKTSSDFDGITSNTKMRLGAPNGALVDSKSYNGNTTEWKKVSRTTKIKSEDIYSLEISIKSEASKGWIDFSEVYLIDITRYTETKNELEKIKQAIIDLGGSV